MKDNKTTSSQNRLHAYSGRAETSVAVLGAGAWGTAIAIALARGGHAVRLHARNAEHAERMRADRANARRLPGHPFPSTLAVGDTILATVAGADAVFLAGPSSAVEAQAIAAHEHVSRHTPFIVCAKGLASDGTFLCERIAKIRNGAPVLMLSGPSFAEEVAEGLQTIVSVSGPADVAARICSRLSSETFVLSPCKDIRGVQVAGVFKNVAAILCGASDGLDAGANSRAALMSEAIREAAAFVDAVGGDPLTLLGPAGFGDFALTCTDPQSRNYSMGYRLASSEDEGDETHEGAANVEALVARADELGVDVPLVEAAADLVAGRASPRVAVGAAFRQRLRRSRKTGKAA
ncbi:NAD(P)H-dependent glycerol-3-phosphate dehydrogenase [Croceicoccus bisphenolivorans]|uniref:NAD(P)H-dependent glycerol-3-phosphate dehydrogenase n=1 Tax=Croceicoccus bisphenolivorans TaxID=1783232 RepID=UPI000B16FBE1|nr:NAD(P)H-dependent glycerol-3-phosphate dehydrogenase [Croceicoccus bisphenolivorans]